MVATAQKRPFCGLKNLKIFLVSGALSIELTSVVHLDLTNGLTASLTLQLH